MQYIINKGATTTSRWRDGFMSTAAHLWLLLWIYLDKGNDVLRTTGERPPVSSAYLAK